MPSMDDSLLITIGSVLILLDILITIIAIRIFLKIREVKVTTNSLTDRLVESTRSAAHAAGIKEEKERQLTNDSS